MNNGNFFPNFNQEPNQDVSLNQMNQQTMETPTPELPSAPVAPEPVLPQAPVIEPTPAPELPTAPIIPQVEIQNMDQPSVVEPEVNSQVVSPIPEFGVNAPVVEPTPAPELPQAPVIEPTAPVVETPEITPAPVEPSVETPLFNETITPPAPVEAAPTEPILPTEPTPAPAVAEAPVEAPVETPAVAPVEAPLFNTELNNNPAPNLNESFYEVPVNVSPVIEPPQEDKLVQVEQLLSSNNIEYKAFSNETGHCIIIEL